MADPLQLFADQINSFAEARDVEKILRHNWEASVRLNKQEAEAFGRHDYANASHSVDGVGQKIGTIPAASWHYWGTRLGYECWDDKEFTMDFFKQNPETMVRNYAKRTMVAGEIFTASGHIASPNTVAV